MLLKEYTGGWGCGLGGFESLAFSMMSHIFNFITTQGESRKICHIEELIVGNIFLTFHKISVVGTIG